MVVAPLWINWRHVNEEKNVEKSEDEEEITEELDKCANEDNDEAENVVQSLRRDSLDARTSVDVAGEEERRSIYNLQQIRRISR